jgi:hypothetical protein
LNLLALSARLKPCAYYKAAETCQVEFFRSLQSPVYFIGFVGPAEAVPLLQSGGDMPGRVFPQPAKPSLFYWLYRHGE